MPFLSHIQCNIAKKKHITLPRQGAKAPPLFVDFLLDLRRKPWLPPVATDKSQRLKQCERQATANVFEENPQGQLGRLGAKVSVSRVYVSSLQYRQFNIQ